MGNQIASIDLPSDISSGCMEERLCQEFWDVIYDTPELNVEILKSWLIDLFHENQGDSMAIIKILIYLEVHDEEGRVALI